MTCIASGQLVSLWYISNIYLPYMLNPQYNNSDSGLFSGFSIQSLSRNDLKKGNGYLHAGRHSIIYISEGSSILQIDFDEFIALKSRVFFIEKYKLWNLNKNHGLKGILVQFTDSFYNFIYTGNPKLKSDQTLVGETPPFIQVSQEEKNEWKTVFDLLLKEYLSPGKNSREVICLLLKVLILLYQRNSQAASRLFESGHKKQLVNEFRKLVNNRFITLRTSKDYARELHITPNYLNALCQEFFLKTVSDIICERVILEAKRMLMHSKLSISEIAYKLGFYDNSYFGRYFKKEVGMTPKSFRSHHVRTPDLNLYKSV
ncbi:MAG: helix-turn-helix domain-containing protein [Bacteroidota bacterium]